MFAAACEGCGSSESTPQSDLIGARSLESNGGSYTLSYSCKPDPIPLNEPFDLRFRIVPRQALENETLSLAVEAQMPEHFHGMNRKPDIRPLGDGTFVASGMLFHMPGHWQIHIDITRRGITERAQCDLSLK